MFGENQCRGTLFPRSPAMSTWKFDVKGFENMFKLGFVFYVPKIQLPLFKVQFAVKRFSCLQTSVCDLSRHFQA